MPFSNVLSEEIVAQALTAIDVYWMDRVYPPLVTLWVFLSQVLSADHSCRAAVARLISHRISRGQGPCSAGAGAYCQARKRLPEKFFSTVACQTGQALEAGVDENWLWKNRRVHMIDGSTVSMPDYGLSHSTSRPDSSCCFAQSPFAMPKWFSDSRKKCP